MRTGRSLLGASRRVLYLLRSPLAIGSLLSMLLIAAVHRSNFAQGQSQAPLIPQYPLAPGQNAGRPQQPGQEADTSQDPMVRHAQLEAAKKRSVERQNKLAADSDKIVQLAQELSVSCGPDEANAASPAMAKKADEIGKLARSVKDLMKSE